MGYGSGRVGSTSRSAFVHVLTSYSILIAEPDDIPEPQSSSAGENLYFEVLELQPIRLAISFMRTERLNTEDRCVVLEAIDAVLTVP